LHLNLKAESFLVCGRPNEKRGAKLLNCCMIFCCRPINCICHGEHMLVICGIASMSPTDSMSQSRHPHDCRSSVCVHIRSHGCHRSPSFIIARNYRCGPTRENRGRDLSSVDRIIEYSSQDDDCQQRRENVYISSDLACLGRSLVVRCVRCACCLNCLVGLFWLIIF